MAALREENLIDHCANVGKYFFDELQELAQNFGKIEQVRARGLMIVVQFDPVKALGYARRIFHTLFAQGFIVGVKPDPNLIRFLPPLNITKQDISAFVQKLEVGCHGL